MAEYPEGDWDTQVASVFFPVAPDAIRTCGGACGNVKPSTAFPTVTGTPGARGSECLACRNRRTGSTTDAASSNGGITVERPALDGRREELRIQRQTVAATVPEVVMSHVGVAMTKSQVSEAVFDRVGFVPAVVDVRDTLRNLAETDTRFVKLGRDAYAWVEEGAVPPPLPTPPHVVQMIERRWLGQTLDDIGTDFGVTRERVRQLIKKYGGPTVEDVRDFRATEALTARRDHETAVAVQLRGALVGLGPMTVVEVVEATGLDSGDVARFWPQELSHLRLWGAGQGESRWSDEDIRAALSEASVYEFPLTTTAYSDLMHAGQIDGASVPTIVQRFGSWSAACGAAGVVPGDPWNREYGSRWSEEDLLQIARAYFADPEAPNSAHRFDEWKRKHAPDGPSAATLRNRFGSWNELKRRALAQEAGLGE